LPRRREHQGAGRRAGTAHPPALPADIAIERLAAHRELLPLIEAWFVAEWPDWYGTDGPGDARRDLEAFANWGSLPVGVVAVADGRPYGIAALKAESIPSQAHLSPWAAAGLVPRKFRGQGIGARLRGGLERAARELGYAAIYCGTDTADRLLVRGGWVLLDRVRHDGQVLGIYRKFL
jgi:GNAT superfamily N-acetyltransferase